MKMDAASTPKHRQLCPHPHGAMKDQKQDERQNGFPNKCSYHIHITDLLLKT
jgi:hypothetical protein